MLTCKNNRVVGSFAVALAVSACASNTLQAFETDAAATLTDIGNALPIIEVVPGVPVWFVQAAPGVLSILNQILSDVQSSGAQLEGNSISTAQALVDQIQKALPNDATVQADAAKAQAVLASLSTVTNQSLEIQAFTALATLELAAVTAESPSSVSQGGTSSNLQILINNANASLDKAKQEAPAS